MIKFIYILLVFFTLSSHAQLVLKGKVLDSESREELSYVNIGVIGKNIGTVSARNGSFELDIPEENYSDLMRISILGYEPIELESNQVEKLLLSQGSIDLKPAAYAIDEVLITSSKMTSKVVGNQKWKENVSAAFFADKLGKEMGIIIKIKKKPTLIKDGTFVLGSNENDTVRFRLNVYTIKKGRPDLNVLSEPIIIEAYKDDEVVTTDLEKYNITVQDDFFISLEWIEDYPDDSLHFAASLFSRPVLSRETSQANWFKVPFLGIGFYATIFQ